MTEAQVRLVVRDRGHELRGAVHEGESWAAAVRRTVASLHADAVPVDLSGETLQFRLDHDNRVTVRAMTPSDLVDIARWRQAEHVHRWWAHEGDPTPERLRAAYGPAIDGMTPTRMYVAEVNGRSIGFLRDYLIADYPQFALRCPDPQAVGVDFAIGEVAWVGRGFGARILWAWMERARRRFPEATSFFAAPDHRNHASLRMLAKVGFTEGVRFDEPRPDGTVATVVGCTLDVSTVLA